MGQWGIDRFQEKWMDPVYSRKKWDVVNVMFGHPWGSDYRVNLEGVRDSCKDTGSTLGGWLGHEMQRCAGSCTRG